MIKITTIIILSGTLSFDRKEPEVFYLEGDYSDVAYEYYKVDKQEDLTDLLYKTILKEEEEKYGPFRP